MATARDALMFYEGGQDANPLELLVDSGDQQTFQISVFPVSNFRDVTTDSRPQVKLDGLATGGAITAAAAADQVDIAAGTAVITGGDIVFAQSLGLALARPTVDTHLIYSIVVDAAGVITAVAGAEGTAFSGTHGAAGGPAFTPVNQVKLGAVRLSSQAAAVILASEIQTGGAFTEFTGAPAIREIDFITGKVVFQAPLPQFHTGNTTREVWLAPFTPQFFQFNATLDWVPADLTGTANTTQFYSGSISSVGQTTANATFTVLMDNGVRDDFLRLVSSEILIKYQPDSADGDHQLTIGTLFKAATNPVDNEIQATVTIIPKQPTVNVVI